VPQSALHIFIFVGDAVEVQELPITNLEDAGPGVLPVLVEEVPKLLEALVLFFRGGYVPIIKHVVPQIKIREQNAVMADTELKSDQPLAILRQLLESTKVRFLSLKLVPCPDGEGLTIFFRQDPANLHLIAKPTIGPAILEHDTLAGTIEHTSPFKDFVRLQGLNGPESNHVVATLHQLILLSRIYTSFHIKQYYTTVYINIQE
jgi:hypothetical protein